MYLIVVFKLYLIESPLKNWGETGFFLAKFIVGNDWVRGLIAVFKSPLKNWGETVFLTKFIIGNDFARWLSKSCVRGAFVKNFLQLYFYIFSATDMIW